MSRGVRSQRMSNARIQQIVTLLFVHKTVVKSEGILNSEAEKLKSFKKRMMQNRDYYLGNPLILASFEFLSTIIDSWY